MSMKFEFSKRMRGVLRQLAAMAHERELHGLLKPLDAAFAQWRKGEMDSGDLVAKVDDFAKGPARRRLAQRYSIESIMHMNVAQAIVRGLLTPEEVPAEVHVALERAIEFYRRGLAAGTVSFDEED
jgi:hypothetical protein